MRTTTVSRESNSRRRVNRKGCSSADVLFGLTGYRHGTNGATSIAAKTTQANRDNTINPMPVLTLVPPRLDNAFQYASPSKPRAFTAAIPRRTWDRYQRLPHTPQTKQTAAPAARSNQRGGSSH